MYSILYNISTIYCINSSIDLKEKKEEEVHNSIGNMALCNIADSKKSVAIKLFEEVIIWFGTIDLIIVDLLNSKYKNK